MADPISTVASSFAVVGLTDVVIRAGKEIYNLLIAITHAPAEVESLRCCIHDNLLLVKDLKLYWQELRASASSPPSATTPALNRALPLFRSALETLNRELTSLAAFHKRHGDITNSKGRFKWVLDEPRILKYLQRLESSKSTLVAALVLVGRYVGMAMLSSELLTASKLPDDRIIFTSEALKVKSIKDFKT